MSSPIKELALKLVEKAEAQERNEDIYVAGLRERETFRAFVDIVNYYKGVYKEPNYFFRLLITEMHKREDDELHEEIMKVWKEV